MKDKTTHAGLTDNTSMHNCVSGSCKLTCNRFSGTPVVTDGHLPLDWTEDLQPVTIEAFTASSGPTAVIPNTPGEVFSLLFTDELLQRISDESNKYAKECMGADKYSRWSDVSAEELKAYLGLCIMMGVVNLPSFDDYWSKDQMLHYTPIAKRIARNRFKDIFRYLHFVDNSTLAPRGDPSYDRLGKIRPLLDYLGQQFRVLYHPSANIAIDEAMIKFQGRSTMKQYMPLKPIKRGIKAWILADSQNGYFWKIQIYVGRQENRDVGLGAHVVQTLLEGLEDKHHRAYFDNFFTSPQLMEDLAKIGIYACGTVRSSRKGFPHRIEESFTKPKVYT
jgi:hypothetical protein